MKTLTLAVLLVVSSNAQTLQTTGPWNSPIRVVTLGTPQAITSAYLSGNTELVASGTTSAWSLAQAGTTGFEAGKWFIANNTGSSNLVITATTSTFSGCSSSGSTLTIGAGQSAQITSASGNYVVDGCGPVTLTAAEVNAVGTISNTTTGKSCCLANGAGARFDFTAGATGIVTADFPSNTASAYTFPLATIFNSGLVQQVSSDPAGACTAPLYPQLNNTNGKLWVCDGTWTQVSGNVTAGATLTSTAIVTGAGGSAIQTPSATATLDTSGNLSTTGTATFGAGTSVAGAVSLTQGTAPSLPANAVAFYAPTSVPTAYGMKLPAANTAGALTNDGSGNMSFVPAAAGGNCGGFQYPLGYGQWNYPNAVAINPSGAPNGGFSFAFSPTCGMSFANGYLYTLTALTGGKGVIFAILNDAGTTMLCQSPVITSAPATTILSWAWTTGPNVAGGKCVLPTLPSANYLFLGTTDDTAFTVAAANSTTLAIAVSNRYAGWGYNYSTGTGGSLSLNLPITPNVYYQSIPFLGVQ